MKNQLFPIVDTPIGEIFMFHDDERDIYQCEWNVEPFPYSTKKESDMLAMALSAQWACDATLSRMKDLFRESYGK